MKPFCVKTADVEVLDRGNGIKTRLLVGKHNGGSVTTGTTTLLAGQAATWHSHNCAEQIMLLEGTARVEYAGGAFEVGTHDVSYIPGGISHRFVNTGPGPMTMFFIYDSPDVTRTFTATGETVEHLSAKDVYRGETR
ncbi:MAG TPA: cupin domain-containing protein [Candidatus Acidoferrales bacterium]|nr:cupin domain-containing protein [Candidatus Acidoferrales bacterium]